MAQNLQVNLAFTADTGQAKAQLQQLQQQLSNLGKNVSLDKSIGQFNTETAKAVANTTKLSAALTQATNQQTGKLDLSLFSQSLKSAGLSLTGISTDMLKLGNTGQQAFLGLAKSILSAETPMKQSNILLKEMGKTLLNTVKWQISSSAIHAFMGGIQSAYSYAQDLDKALTDIRIVSGNSAEYMQKFAKSANEAAQALSTTTTAYAEAALIFYQQGLSDDQVAARTEATVKMAEATGDAASDVSSYMTAIWNNFDDGSQSLGHYADVIVALGASTASSSSEIAEGLEKFAAVADTVGMSYEYATSAMATIVANTRQSADTVGTSLKTLLARIQDLELGDQGSVSLGTYAEALKKVGINVLDTKGNMRDMDDILDDMGKKWDTLSSAQQTALAQNVAGTRQYTQLVALMDNWDDFQTNLNTANTSEGTLDEQVEIYAESWEGSEKRVKAAAQAIYNDLIDEDFFKSLNNVFAVLLKGLDSFINQIGGIKGILAGLAVIFTNVFSSEITSGINRGIQNLKVNLGMAQSEAEKLQQETRNIFSTITSWKGTSNTAQWASLDHLELENSAYLTEVENLIKIRDIWKNLSPLQQESLTKLMSINSELVQSAAKAQELLEKMRAAVGAENTSLQNNVFDRTHKKMLENGSSQTEANNAARNNQQLVQNQFLAMIGSGSAAQNQEFTNNNEIAKILIEQSNLTETQKQQRKDLLDFYQDEQDFLTENIQSDQKRIDEIDEENNKLKEQNQLLDEQSKKIDVNALEITAKQKQQEAVQATNKSSTAYSQMKGTEQKKEDAWTEYQRRVNGGTNAQGAQYTQAEIQYSLDVYNKLNQQYEAELKRAQQLENAAKKAGNAASKAKKAVQDAKDKKAELTSEQQQNQKQINTNNTERTSLDGDIRTNISARDVSIANSDALKNVFSGEKINYAELSAEQITRMSSALAAADETGQTTAKDWEKVISRMKEMGEQAPLTADAIRRAAESQNEFDRQIAAAEQTTRSFAMGVTSAMQGLSQFAMGLTSLQSAWNTLQDTDTSFFEKFPSLLMSATMGLPMVVSGLMKFVSALGQIQVIQSTSIASILAQAAASGVLKTSLDQSKAGTLSYAVANLIAKKSTEDNTISLIGNTKALEILDKCKNKDAIATELAALQNGELSIAQAKVALAAILEKGELDNDQKAKLSNIIATLGLKAANEGLAASMLLWAGIIIAIVAAVALLTAAIYVVYNADELAAKSAQKKLEEQQEKVQELQDAYNELTDTITNITDAQDALKEMTTGTQEWKDAVSELNQEILTALETYPELAGAIKSENGSLTLDTDSDAYKNYIETQQAELNDELDTEYANAVDYYNKQNTSDLTNLSREIFGSHIGQEDLSSLVNSTIVEGLSKLKYDNADISTIGTNENETIDYLRKYFNDDQIQELINSADNITTTIDTILSRNNASLLLNDKIAGNKLENEGSSIYKNASEQQQQFMRNYTSANLENAYGKNIDKISDAIQRTAQASGGSLSIDDSEEIAKKIINGVDLSTISNDYAIDLNSFEGELNSVGLDINNLSANFSSLAEQSLQVYNAFKQIADESNISDEGLNQFAGLSSGQADFNQLSTNDVNALSAMINDAFWDEDLTELMDPSEYGDQQEAILAAGGFETYEDMIDAFNQQVAIKNIANQSLNSEAKSSSSVVHDEWENSDVIKDNMDISEKDSYLNLLQDTYSTFGTESTKSLAAGLRAAGDDASQLVSIISGIDFSSGSGYQDFLAALDAAGIKVSDVDQTILDWVFNMDAASNTAYNLLNNFQQIKATVASIYELTSDDMSFGDIISDEDYQTLIKYNSAIAQLFSQTVDGWAYLGESSADLKQYTEAGSNFDLQSYKDAYDQMYYTGQNLNSWTRDGEAFDWSSFSTMGDDAKAETLDNMIHSKNGNDYSQLYAASGTNADEIQEYIDLVNTTGDLTDEQQTRLTELEEKMNNVGNTASEIITNMNNGVYSSVEAEKIWISASVESLAELQGAYDAGTISAQAYAESIDLVAQKEAEALGLDYEDVEAQKELLMSEAERKGALDKTDESLASVNAQYARQAILNASMNKGLTTLASKWSDWNKILKNSDVTAADYAETCNDMKDTLAEMLGITDDSIISVDMFNKNTAEGAENIKLMAKAAKGDTGAIDQLGTNVAKNYINNLSFTDSAAFSNLAEEADEAASKNNDSEVARLTNEAFSMASAFDSAKQTVISGLDAINSAAAGTSLADALGGEDMANSWVDALNTMALDTEMSVEEMNSLLNSMGVQADVTTTEKETKVQVPVYRTETTNIQPIKDEDGTVIGHSSDTKTWQVGTETMDGVIEVAQINTGDNAGTSPTVTDRGKVSSSARARSSGGSSRTSTAQTHQKAESSDRYIEITTQIEDLTDELEDLSDAEDKAYGETKLDLMDQQISKIEDLVEAQKEYREEIQENLKLDTNNLNNGTVEYVISAGDNEGKLVTLSAGVENYLGEKATFDANGVITNQEDLKEKALAKYNEAIDTYNNAVAGKTLGDGEEEKFKDTLEQAKAQYEAFIAYIDQYNETNDLLQDQADEMADLFSQALELKLEKTEYTVSLKTDLADSNLDYIDYLMSKIEDSSYNAAEQIELLSAKTAENLDKANATISGMNELFSESLMDGTSFSDYISRIMQAESADAVQTIYDELTAQGFSSDVMDQLKEYASDLISINQDLMDNESEILEEMADNFSEVADNYSDALDKTDIISDIYDSYKNIVELLGDTYVKASDDALSKLDEAAYNNGLAKMNTAKAQYEELADELNAMQKEYNGLTNLTDDEKDMWEEKLADMDSTVSDAYTEFLSDYEDLLQDISDKWEDLLETVADNFGNAFANIADANSFDELQDLLDRQENLTEDYLDDYEKAYELASLSRDVANSIDDTDNLKGKENLLAIQEKILAAQKDTDALSDYELENLQKEYELEVARIALEEAQNAKKMVRLTRDNEGNYSYVYTADESELDSARDNYEKVLKEWTDTNNEAIEDQRDKLLSLPDEFQDAVDKLGETYEIGSADYLAALDELRKYYLDMANESTDIINQALSSNKDLQQAYVDEYGKTIDLIDDITETGLAGVGTTIDSYLSDLTSSINDAFSDAKTAAEQIAALNENTADQAGLFDADTTEEMDSQVDDAADALIKLTSAQQNALSNLNTEAEKSFKNTLTSIQSFMTNYTDTLHTAIQEAEKEIETYLTLAEKLSGTTMSVTANDGEVGSVTVEAIPDTVSATTAATYDTGGYTGVWGSEGKLAILHQKELVLNAQQTEDMLSAMEFLDGITSTLDNLAVSAPSQLQLPSTMTTVNGASANTMQNITINAEFPSATDHNEIQLAFDNILLRASQYAGRNV